MERQEGSQPSEARIAALERELARTRRRLRIAFALSALGIAVAVVSMIAHALPQRELRASRLVLVDTLGRTRAALELQESGPALSLMGADEAPRARLAVTGQLGGLHFLDAEGGERLSLSGRPSLLLSDQGRSRLSLGVSAEGPALELVDPQGFATFHPVDGLKLFGEGGAPSASLEPGALSLYTAARGPDAQLSVSLSAPRRPGERVRLLLYDRGEAPSFVAP